MFLLDLDVDTASVTSKPDNWKALKCLVFARPLNMSSFLGGEG